MAFYDWNRNGKKDLQDDYIEYNIYKQCMENDNDNRGGCSNNSGCAFVLCMIIVVVVLAVLGVN